jgi:hypothetical protein
MSRQQELEKMEKELILEKKLNRKRREEIERVKRK